jgi:hypothetical protein
VTVDIELQTAGCVKSWEKAAEVVGEVNCEDLLGACQRDGSSILE